jgi:L-asparaginase/Glu-tRNA(Gln) amidotransferase subunit D
VAYEAQQEFAYPTAKVFEAITQAIPQISKMTITSADPATGVVLASTGASIWSWGEKYTISVRELAADRTQVHVEVRLKAQLFGWGKQKQGISQFFATLTHALQQGA